MKHVWKYVLEAVGVVIMATIIWYFVYNHYNRDEAENAVVIQLDELVTNAVYRATAEFTVDPQNVSWMVYPVYERKLGVDWDESPYANIVAAPTFDPEKFRMKKEVENKYVAAL